MALPLPTSLVGCVNFVHFFALPEAETSFNALIQHAIQDMIILAMHFYLIMPREATSQICALDLPNLPITRATN